MRLFQILFLFLSIHLAGQDCQKIWSVEYPKNANRDLLVKSEIESELSLDNQIICLNSRFRPELKVLKISQSEVFVEIVNSEILTQQMGTQGADDYLAVVTFTLTEIKGINAVHFTFIEGDHGGKPGIKSRQDFSSMYTWFN